MSEPQDLLDRIKRCVEQLGEHADCVQILVSTQVDEGKTRMIKWGCGNWYARQGMAIEFINSDARAELSEELGKRINPPPDEDSWKDSA